MKVFTSFFSGIGVALLGCNSRSHCADKEETITTPTRTAVAECANDNNSVQSSDGSSVAYRLLVTSGHASKQVQLTASEDASTQQMHLPAIEPIPAAVPLEPSPLPPQQQILQSGSSSSRSIHPNPAAPAAADCKSTFFSTVERASNEQQQQTAPLSSTAHVFTSGSAPRAIIHQHNGVADSRAPAAAAVPVRYFLSDRGQKAPSAARAGSSSISDPIRLKILALLQPASESAVQVAQNSDRLARVLRDQLQVPGPCPVPELAVALATSDLDCRVLLRRVTDTKEYWSRSMGGQFIVCVPLGARQVGKGLVVDPNFKDQFSTPHMTQRYREVWSLLPEVFVGLASQLAPLLQLLCLELTVLFEDLCSPLPPWRSYSAMFGRWLSASCFDLAVAPTSGPGTVADLNLMLAHIDAQAHLAGGAGKGRPAPTVVAAAVAEPSKEGPTSLPGSYKVVTRGFILKDEAAA